MLAIQHRKLTYACCCVWNYAAVEVHGIKMYRFPAF